MSFSAWAQCRLADICESVDYGYTTSASSVPSGPHFLRITDIVKENVDWHKVPFCNAEERELEKYRLHHGDIVIARTGASTGASAFIQEPPKAVFASYLVRLKIRRSADARFVSYYLKSKYFWDYMYGVLGEKSAQPNASAKTLTQAPILLPPIRAQRNIASILGSLDDKIELNRRMNETLEEMARAFFKSWFVDFDPMRAKMEGHQPIVMDEETAALFPDSFEDSALGEIPKGWMVEPLDQIAHFLNGVALQKYPPEDDEYLPAIKIAELRKGVTASSGRASTGIPSQYVVEDGDVLFSWSGSLEAKLWTGGRGALNQHLFKVSSERYSKWLYYYWIKQHLPEFRMIAADKATTMGHIKRHHLTDALTVVPPAPVLQKMSTTMEPIVSMILNNDLESRTLAALRDTLLPKLVSGEATLSTG